MLIESLIHNQSLPAVVSAENAGDGTLFTLTKWIETHGRLINEHLYQSGAILFRGFEITSAEDFRLVSTAIRPELRNYTGGDSPRHSVADKVYTSTEYPSHLEVLLHNELSYAGWSPETIFFCCMQAPETGGETPVADGRVVYALLYPGVRSKFEEKGIIYLQHLWDGNGERGAGKSWQETFESEDKSVAEKYLVQSGMEFEWTEYGIRTAVRKPAVLAHPVTGEMCWFNQADQWHREMVSVKDLVSGSREPQTQPDPTSGEETLGNHVRYGDGSSICVDDLRHIREVSSQHEVVFPWQESDIMLIDNILTMHGRKPFTGNRRVLVTIA